MGWNVLLLKRFVIGQDDLKNGVMYGWLSTLGNKTGHEYTVSMDKNGTLVCRIMYNSYFITNNI